MAKHCITQTVLHNTPGILVYFSGAKDLGEIQIGFPPAVAPLTGGVG